MKLLCDVGNTTTRFGLLGDGEISRCLQFKTRPVSTADELWGKLNHLLGLEGEKVSLSVACVVPEVVTSLEKMAESYLEEISFLKPPWEPVTIEVGVNKPGQVGADRISGAEALYHLYGGGLVVDYGTATTVEAVSERGEYLGGVIMPGIEAAARGLATKAAALPDFSPQPPDEFGCQNTSEALQSGLFHGTSGAVQHVLELLRAQFSLSENLPVVGTGGRLQEMDEVSGFIDKNEPDLVLKGLARCFHSGRL